MATVLSWILAVTDCVPLVPWWPCTLAPSPVWPEGQVSVKYFILATRLDLEFAPAAPVGLPNLLLASCAWVSEAAANMPSS